MRRFAIISAGFAAAALLAVLALPLWLGFALWAVGPSFGLRFQEYQRNGYGEFTLQGVRYTRPGVRVEADRVTSATPLLWWTNRVSGTPTAIVAGTWRTMVEPTQQTSPTAKPRGWMPLREQLNRVFDIVAYWVPRAEIGPGTVKWKGGELAIGPTTWSERTLVAAGVTYRVVSADVRIEAKKNEELRAALKLVDGSGNLNVATNGPRLIGSGTWWGQRAELTASFPAQGWMPTEAAFQSHGWSLPGERVKLAPHYVTLRGDADVRWVGGELTASVTMEGEPAANTKAPPLSVKLEGEGRGGRFSANVLDVALPGFTVRLNEPVSIDRTGKLHSATSRFELTGDLSKQLWFPAQGLVRGRGTVAPGEGGLARIDFSVEGEDFRVSETALSQAAAEGTFQWPNLAVRSGRVRMPDGKEVTLSGGWNFKTREASEAIVEGSIGPEILAQWVPEQVRFESATISARASGPLATLAHEGRITVTQALVEKINPLAVAGTWNGRGSSIDGFAVEASAGATKIAAEGAVNPVALRLTGLSLTNGDITRFSLVEPATLRWENGLALEPLRLEGSNARLHAALVHRESGSFTTSIRNFQSEWLRDIVQLPPTVWAVDSLDAKGEWSNGPATYSAEGLATVHLGPGRAAQILAQVNGDARGLKVTSARVAEGTGVILNASGQVPVVVTPKKRPLFNIDDDASFTLQAATSPNPEFWSKLSELAGIDVVQPEMLVNFAGTWVEPRGEARIRAQRIAPLPGRFKISWPKIEALEVVLTGDRGGMNLENFSVAVEGQTVRAKGSLPVEAERWGELVRDPRAFVRHGKLHVEIPGADLAAIAHHFPAYLAPKGQLELDLTFEADESITGFFRVKDATSRPLGPLGVLQEVNANLSFEGRAVNLEGVTARMGGQEVVLQGRAELPKGEKPRLDLTLKGENLPFVRRTGLLLRGDLDLKLTGAGSLATISGDVRLRDSLFLTDIRALIPSGGAKGGVHRPPYFAIEAPPLNAWRLNVAVNGERFLRLRTPVFNGTASARFRLSGTLGDPRIEGEAIVDEGNVRLPFANFAVQQGQVRLSPGELEPQIWVTGTTRRYGYDVRMELTGTTSSQNLTFSSSPPLEAEQVLLMVMAGEAPQNEVTTTNRQRMARFGAFFGQSLLGSIGGGGGGSDRLTISSGENVSAQGRETYSIEYRLDQRWALTGEYDEFDDYYGGVKWRVYERGGSKTDDKD